MVFALPAIAPVCPNGSGDVNDFQAAGDMGVGTTCQAEPTPATGPVRCRSGLCQGSRRRSADL